jgi:hypothetical protein
MAAAEEWGMGEELRPEPGSFLVEMQRGDGATCVQP